jgi:ABC-type sugar transport system ATPase subunit
MTVTPFAARVRMIWKSLRSSLSVSAAEGSSMIRTDAVTDSAFTISTTCCCTTDSSSAALTDKELRKLFQIIRTLAAKGVTVIYISHMLEEVFEIADRVSVLKDGRVMGTRSSRELSREDLVRMMVGRTIEDYFPPLARERGPVLLGVRGLTKRGSLSDIGLEHYDAGEIVVKGKGRPLRSFHDAMGAGFGYITDDRKAQGILGPMSVQENMTIANLGSYLSLGFLNRRRENADSRRQMDVLGIKATGIGQAVQTLSGGNQQKVLIARWLLRQPDVFVISEPTRGIDVGAKAEIYRIMREVTAAGKAILMISSELPEVIGMSDRIIVMRGGRIEGVIDQTGAGGAFPHEGAATEEQIMSLAVGHEYSIHRGDAQ